MNPKQPARARTAAILILAALAIVSAQVTTAQSRWIDATASTDLGPILRDEMRDRIYLGDSATREVVVIDSLTEQIVARIGVPGRVADLALTKDNDSLGVIGGGYFTRIDLSTLRARTAGVPAEVSGQTMSLAFDSGNRIYVGTGYFTSGLVYVLNSRGSKVVNSFGLGPNLSLPTYHPLLQTDVTGDFLYVSDRGLSPLSIHKFDISHHKKVKYLADDAHGSLGSNLRDFALSNRYDELYVASGYPYGIQVVDAASMEFVSLLDTGPYPAGVAVGPLGNEVFGIPSSSSNNFLFEFDAVTRTEIRSYVLESQVHNGQAWARGLAVDRFGEKAFVVHGGNTGTAVLKVQVLDLVSN